MWEEVVELIPMDLDEIGVTVSKSEIRGGFGNTLQDLRIIRIIDEILNFKM